MAKITGKQVDQGTTIIKADPLWGVGLDACAWPTRLPLNPVDLMQQVERLVQLLSDDLAGVNIQLGEERLVQDRPYCLAGLFIKSVRLLQQAQRLFKDRSASGQQLFCLGNAALDLPLLVTERLHLGAELVLRPTLIGGQVEEIVLLLVQRSQAAAKTLPHLS